MQLNFRLTTKFLAVAMMLVVILVTVGAEGAQSLPDYKPIDVGPRLRATGPEDVIVNFDDYAGQFAATDSASPTAVEDYAVGDIKLGFWYDDTAGIYLADYEVMAIGEHIEVWVMTDLSFPDGDPRNPVEITQEQVDYLVDEFDNNIYDKMNEFFGPADNLDGTNALFTSWFGEDYYDADGRVIAMISNVGDDSYYDPTYPNYIAGFYWGGVTEPYFDRNIISIDSYDWANRVGSPRYVYESVFTHEYQHLLHDDYDSNEESWINEGLSMWSEPLVGYPVPTGYTDDVAARPENSLVIWGDQGGREILVDYGIAYMYVQYMYEQYGEAFIQETFLDGTYQGIASVEEFLDNTDPDTSFADTFYALSIGMYTGGLFELDELQDFQVDVGHPGQRNPDAFATPGAPPWGSDYILIWGPEQIANMSFNGFEFNPLGWTSDGSVLFSGAANSLDHWAIFEATGGGTLNFDTNYDIEVEWDYAFVQVSTDGGFTWTSLSNEYTTSDIDPDADPAIAANLPGLNGSSGGWVNMSFDLSAYPGDILIGLRYMTDGAVVNPGWFVDNIDVDGTVISDGSSTDGLKSLNEVLDISNEYTVTLIGERTRRGQVEYQVLDPFDGGFQFDDIQVRALFDNYKQVVMVVTYNAPQGVSSYADYGIVIDHRGGKNLR